LIDLDLTAANRPLVGKRVDRELTFWRLYLVPCHTSVELIELAMSSVFWGVLASVGNCGSWYCGLTLAQLADWLIHCFYFACLYISLCFIIFSS